MFPPGVTAEGVLSSPNYPGKAADSPMLNCSHPLPAAPSWIFLNQGITTASPSCLGGGWSSAGELVLSSLTPASLGWKATPAGLTSTR